MPNRPITPEMIQQMAEKARTWCDLCIGNSGETDTFLTARGEWWWLVAFFQEIQPFAAGWEAEHWLRRKLGLDVHPDLAAAAEGEIEMDDDDLAGLDLYVPPGVDLEVTTRVCAKCVADRTPFPPPGPEGAIPVVQQPVLM
jgi:hypothetical protein